MRLIVYVQKEGEKLFGEELYDPVLEELKGISALLKEIEKLVEQQISIESTNTILLKKLVERGNDIKHVHSMQYERDTCLQNNFLIIDSSIEKGIELAKEITSNINGKFMISEAKTDGEFASLINRLSAGDVVFVDISDPLFDNKAKQVLSECIKERCINITIGKGAGSRQVSLDIPQISFIVYTCLEEFLPYGLKEYLIQI